ncbi:MAG: hypothetical protein A2161_11395 [Candidatus Schekmanbacteria bacterium RBG_13_48_7]|uniref:Peptidase M16 C-terminal domain-containing protein n=1 Tax=Candidatus Schekmanbacteria bacterium RBG_13_48_7 TaxID=1817878 RepID=A0A1F7S800_9BACT|nr:MAG: hypothetical protein A2161_11395 [Candidatus Schekmanbacteria bacterium RBG_13_48_7]
MRLCIQNLYRTMFENHPYGFNLFGTEESIQKLNRDDLVAWYKRYFVNNRIIISVVGDVSKKSVEESISEYFGKTIREKTGDIELQTPGLGGVKSKIETREKRQTSLSIGFKCPGVKHEDFFALTVMDEILSGMGGRLFINLRDRDYLGYIIHSYFDPCYDAGAYWIFLGIPPEREEEAFQKTFAELQIIKTSPVNEKELSDAKSAIIGNRLIDLQHNSVLALEYAKREMLQQRDLSETVFAQKIQMIKAEDIMRVANEYFDFENYALSIIRPQNK